MATGNPSYSDLIATTLERREKPMIDAVTTHNGLLRAMKARNGVKTAPGGTSIVQPIEFKSNANFGWFEGYDLLPIMPQEVHTATQYAWKNASVAVTISGTEIAKNSGPDQIMDLLDAKIMNAEHTMLNGIASGLYAPGTGSGGKELGGLAHLISTTPTTGTVGGIDRSDATNAFWRNKATDATTTYADSTIRAQMLAMWLQCVRGSDHPNAIVTDGVAWTAYNNTLLALQQITTPDTARGGYSNLVFYGPGGNADVIYDPLCTADRMWFINLDTFKLRPHANRYMKSSPARFSLNQDAEVHHMFFMGNCTLNNAILNGVIFT